MNKIIVVTVVFLCLFSFEFKGQNLSNHKLNKIARDTPDSVKTFAFDIVDYFKTKTDNPKKLVLLFNYWIGQNISYDVEKYLSDNRNYVNVWATLDTKKAMCQEYSELLCELCYWADIDCEIITGYAKGFGFDGKPLKKTNHIWNAVLIGNKWELVDATWAVGFLNYRKGNLVFNKFFNNQYVFAKPSELILTHFPVDSKWQLLNSPITIDAFFSEVKE